MKTLALVLVLAPVYSGGIMYAADAVSDDRRERFRQHGEIEPEDQPTIDRRERNGKSRRNVTEAPVGFDNLTNGYLEQGPDFETLDDDTVAALRSFNDNRFIFEEVETLEDGLGPVYNAQSCRECHQNVVTGGASQIAEHRTGRLYGDQFFESLGGSLVHSRATHGELVERVISATRRFILTATSCCTTSVRAMAFPFCRRTSSRLPRR